MEWSDPLAQLLRAGVAATRGDSEDAGALLGSAAAGFDAAHMRLYAAAARRRLGEVMGGDEGRSIIHAAAAWMAAQKVQNPARMTAMLAPGRFARSGSC